MSTSVLHEAKITPEHFENIINGTKTFEIRKDDRNPPYSPADELKLREWNNCKYTGRWALCDIRLVLRNEYCKEGYCTMSILLKDSGIEQFPSAKGVSTTRNSELDRLKQENEQLREQLKQFESLQAPQEANEYDCCPRCSTYLKDENGVEGDYCPNCGQCIKWLLEQNYEVTI